MITRPRLHVSTLIFENSSFPDLIPARSETVTPSGRLGLFFSRGDRSNPQLILVLFPPLRLGDVSSIRGIKTGQFHVSPRLAKLTYAGRSSSALQPRLTLSLLLKMKFLSTFLKKSAAPLVEIAIFGIKLAETKVSPRKEFEGEIRRRTQTTRISLARGWYSFRGCLKRKKKKKRKYNIYIYINIKYVL